MDAFDKTVAAVQAAMSKKSPAYDEALRQRLAACSPSGRDSFLFSNPVITDVRQIDDKRFSVTTQPAETFGTLEPGQILTSDSRQPRDEPPYRYDEAESIL